MMMMMMMMIDDDDDDDSLFYDHAVYLTILTVVYNIQENGTTIELKFLYNGTLQPM